jgi:hypothetical protein
LRCVALRGVASRGGAGRCDYFSNRLGQDSVTVLPQTSIG